MQETLAMTIVSRRVKSAAVAACRSRSISSLTGAVLVDEEVPLRDVGLRLVVVVVADEVLDRVLREELSKLAAELRGERLVVRDHQRRPLDLLDDGRHREGLAGAGGAEQCLEAVAGLQAFDEFVAGLGLVGRRFVFACEDEFVVGCDGHGVRLRGGTDVRFGGV